jgi:hypothetical protein
MMQVVEQHTSDDGLLKFMVCRDDDGDMALGFEGFAWHTHADLLRKLYGLPHDDAVGCFIDDILEDRAIIAVCWLGDTIRDVWINGDPASESKYKPEGETIEFRYWSGCRASGEL